MPAPLMLRLSALALVSLLLLPGMLPAQDECPDAAPTLARELAELYAPVLSFAPGERYFPTIPFFQAFDGFDGPFRDTLVASGPLRDGRVDYGLLDEAYQRRLITSSRHVAVHEPEAAAVFYRVRCLSSRQARQLWGFLRNDHVAFTRTGLKDLYLESLRDAEFAVVEYYLYYVRDVGLQGHPHDIERIFVFAPRQVAGRAMDKASRDALSTELRVVVGTGHSSTTPNNVLVLVDRDVEALANPSFLIELGGHSSAPDVDRDNRFQVGLDINWNLSASVWGTRDIQAVSGRGFLGDFQPAMAFPRAPCTATLMIPTDYSLEKITPAQWARPATEVPLRLDEAEEECGVSGPAPSPRPVSYALLPVEPFERLARQAERLPDARTASDTAARTDSAGAVLAELRDLLVGSDWRFEGLPGNPPSQPALLAALRALDRWRSIQGAGNTRIWEHPDYAGSPIRVLKRRLYRPTFLGLQNAGDVLSLFYGAYSLHTGGGAEQLLLGAVVPATGFLAVPGVIELQGGMAWPRAPFEGDGRISWSALYERHYRATFSWYIRPVDFVSRRSTLEENGGGFSEFSMAAGVSVMPFFNFPDKPVIGPLLSQRLRVRLGLRADIVEWQPRVARFEVQTVLYVR